jgi:hypothetical protein
MSLTNNKNFLQPSGFRIVIEREKYANLEFFSQSVSHPGSQVSAIELGIPRIQGLPISGDTIDYGDLTVSLILDEDLQSYKEMQLWLEDCVYKKGETVNHDITVIILNSHNNSCGKIRYKNAIPTAVGQIEFTSTSGDVSYISFDVTFRFTEFELS